MDEVKDMLHVEASTPPLPAAFPEEAGPKQHITFPSSSSEANSGDGDADVAKASSKADGDDDDDEGDDDDRDTRVFRSGYLGRGNVKAVRAARKQAGLSEAFPRSDPLLMEFADFLRFLRKAHKDVENKVSFIISIM